MIRVIYDFSRTGSRHISMATFREEDVAAGKPISEAVRLRLLVSEASGGQEKKPEPVRDNADGETLRRQKHGSLGTVEFRAEPLRRGAKLFTDRTYVLEDDLVALNGVSFLQIPLDGSKTLTCVRTGTVWLLTPTPDRTLQRRPRARRLRPRRRRLWQRRRPSRRRRRRSPLPPRSRRKSRTPGPLGPDGKSRPPAAS